MNIVTERDGLEIVSEHGVWTLYLVEDGGGKYTALATMNDYRAVSLLSAYLDRGPRHDNDDSKRAMAANRRFDRFFVNGEWPTNDDGDEVPF